MNPLAEWLAAVIHAAHSAGAWLLWVALLLVLGALPSLMPRAAADRGPRSVVSMWAGLLLAAVAVARGEAILHELARLAQAAERSAASQAGRLDALAARLPDGAAPWLAQLPWREIGLAGALLALVAVFYLPRRSRFGHWR